MSTLTPPFPEAGAAGREDVLRWVGAREALDSTKGEVASLEATRGVATFRSQLDLLERRLVADPRTFRDMFIADGMQAVAWEFRQPELSRDFVVRLWDMLLRDDDVSTVLMRFIWDLPLGKKRTFIRAIETHLSDRYPMFELRQSLLRGRRVAWWWCRCCVVSCVFRACGAA